MRHLPDLGTCSHSLCHSDVHESAGTPGQALMRVGGNEHDGTVARSDNVKVSAAVEGGRNRGQQEAAGSHTEKLRVDIGNGGRDLVDRFCRALLQGFSQLTAGLCPAVAGHPVHNHVKKNLRRQGRGSADCPSP